SRSKRRSGSPARSGKSLGSNAEARCCSQARGESAATAQLMKPLFASRLAKLLNGFCLWLLLAPIGTAQVLKIIVDDTIQPITEEYIGRAIAEAHARNASALLIEMNTPGGLVTSTRGIIEKITTSPVPF